MGVRPMRALRPPHKETNAGLLVVSIAASLLVLVGLHHYAFDGLNLIQTAAAPAVGAPWHPVSGNAQPERAAAVRAAMEHAWHGYESYAWGADELRPTSKKGKRGVMGSMHGFSGLGASVVDAMSTLHLMGLHEEFERAHAWVAENMTFEPKFKQRISFFETTIRLVGGLLAAHDLSGHRLFLDKAVDLGRRLLPVFDGAATGILHNGAALPWSSNTTSRQATFGNSDSFYGRTAFDDANSDVLLAELGSNLIEFGTLAARSGNDTYRRKAEAGLRFLHAMHPDNPLLGISITRETGEIQETMQTVGAPADSYFEYLLKYWILTGKKDDHWRYRWINATDAALNDLVVRPANANFSFTGERFSMMDAPNPTLTHLGCYFPGSVALGVISGAVEGDRAARYLDFAQSMMQACYQLYNITATGLGVDSLMFGSNGNPIVTQHMYLQRPEVVESLFYLWRATHDERYREWGWSIVEALERNCRTDAGYTGVRSATAHPERVITDDTQQSWFLAETLKYLFLLFSDDGMLRLDEWVFNTEAHPMRAATQEGKQWVAWDAVLPIAGVW